MSVSWKEGILSMEFPEGYEVKLSDRGAYRIIYLKDPVQVPSWHWYRDRWWWVTGCSFYRDTIAA